MKRAFFLLVMACTLCACEPSAVKQGRDLYKMYFHKVLKDPSSLVIYDEKYEMDGKYSVKWTLDVGAKNSYGGMVRKTYNISTVGGNLIKDDRGNLINKTELR